MKVKPSSLELQVLALINRMKYANQKAYGKGMTVREISGAMPDGKERAYTTILSVCQVMEKKGLLTHRKDGTAHRYKADVDVSAVIRSHLKELVTNVFGGDKAVVIETIESL